MSQIEAPPTRGLRMLCAVRTQEEKKALRSVLGLAMGDLREGCSNSTLLAAPVQHTTEEKTTDYMGRREVEEQCDGLKKDDGTHKRKIREL